MTKSICLNVIVYVLSFVVSAGCEEQGTKVLQYEGVDFVEQGDRYCCGIDLSSKALDRWMIKRPDGKVISAADIDEAWVSEVVEARKITDIEGKHRVHLVSTWIDMHVVNGKRSSIFLMNDAAVGVKGDGFVLLNATEPQITKAFGKPRRIYHNPPRTAP